MTPTKWLLRSDRVEMTNELLWVRKYPNLVPLCYFTPVNDAPGREGWYDLREVHEALRAWQRSVDAKGGQLGNDE
jgi:hypothetical protein